MKSHFFPLKLKLGKVRIYVDKITSDIDTPSDATLPGGIDANNQQFGDPELDEGPVIHGTALPEDDHISSSQEDIADKKNITGTLQVDIENLSMPESLTQTDCNMQSHSDDVNTESAEILEKEDAVAVDENNNQLEDIEKQDVPTNSAEGLQDQENIEQPYCVPAEIVEESKSILDNKPYVKLLEDLFALSKEVDRIAEKTTDDTREIAMHFYERLEDIFERTELSAIENDSEFDVRRHQSIPVANIQDGTKILNTIVPGWTLENRVFRRAKVSVEKHEDSEI